MRGRKVWMVGLLATLALAGCAAVSGEPVPVSGDITVHDPGLVVGTDEYPWMVFSTGDARESGGSIQLRTSPDGEEWTYAGGLWDAGSQPTWAIERIPTVSNFWAPEVRRHDDTWYVWYSASTFGSNKSSIGLTTTDAVDPTAEGTEWTDQGEVLSSSALDDYNAIDPAVLIEDDGSAWMAFGSFWGGIQLVPLEMPSGKPPEGAVPTTIASRLDSENAIEAPALLHHGDYYYLFVSFDRCCRGTDSTYNINVGRAETPEGPYVDADGTPMTEGGGTQLLGTGGNRVGPGGESVWGDTMAYHYYDADLDGEPQLAIVTMGWTDDGWPVIAPKE